MNYFIDTNVAIGYTVVHDKWHEPSRDFITNCEDSIFWSNLVVKEYGEKLDEILDVIDEFLKICSSILRKNEMDFYSLFEFEMFILKKTSFCDLDDIKKQKIINHFWNKNNFTIGISTNLHSNFLRFADDFEEVYHQRDSTLNKILKLHNCGLKNFIKYYEYALKLYNGGVHSPDCRIIVDAHDCGLKYDDLIFLTTDEKMFEAIIRQDTSYLKILEFKLCN